MFSSFMVSASFFLKSHRRRRLPVFCSSALRIKALSVTPGTSSGFWKERKMPFLARALTGRFVMSSPSNTMLPSVTLIGGVAGHGIAQRGLAGAVRPHQHMGFIFTNTQIHAVENFLLLHANVKIIDLQKLFFHVVPSSFPRILAEEFLPFR